MDPSLKLKNKLINEEEEDRNKRGEKRVVGKDKFPELPEI
jgi:hypothetical protein